jgi:hypothetical protein
LKEFIIGIISLPFYSLFLMPAYYVGVWLIKAKKLNFGGAFLLVLITGALVQIVGLILPSIPSPDSLWAKLAVTLIYYAVVAGFVFGYFVRAESGRSIGVLKGMFMSFIFVIVGGVTLPLLAMGIAGVTKIISLLHLG